MTTAELRGRRLPAVDPALLPRPAAAVLRLAAVAVIYALYAYARNQHGLASTAAWEAAQRHADAVLALQQALHLPHERELQQLVLGSEWLVRASGAYYGSAHFLGTAGVLLLLALRRPGLLTRLGSTLGLSTFVAVGVFALYPVAPPRLMPPGQQTVDTLASVGGIWSYDHGVLERISDPFAAMPSLHLAWATWCALVLWVLARDAGRPRAWRAVAVAHPVLTLVVVLVTGNHWYLDAVAGVLLVLAVAALQAVVQARAVQARVALASTRSPSYSTAA
ncbi:MAG: phosphatase PAP2 family protein [Mycobacteriales bacterium]